MRKLLITTLIALPLTFGVAACDGGGCPAGQQSEFSHYLPVFNGKTMTLIPQYECR